MASQDNDAISRLKARIAALVTDLEDYRESFHLWDWDIRSNVLPGVSTDDADLNWILANSEPMFRRDTRDIMGVLLTCTDITERSQAEQELALVAQVFHCLLPCGLDVAHWDLAKAVETVGIFNTRRRVGPRLLA